MLIPLGHLDWEFGCWTRRGLLERALSSDASTGVPDQSTEWDPNTGGITSVRDRTGCADSSWRPKTGLRFRFGALPTHPMGMQDEKISPRQCPRPRLSPHVFPTSPYRSAEGEIRGRRSVVSTEAERERSSGEALHGPSLQRHQLSGRVEGMTGPPTECDAQLILRVVRSGGSETRKRIASLE